MSEQAYDYVIVGGGLAGASAAQAIRDHDPKGAVLLIGAESRRPYNRPPLSKQLWFGKKKVEDIFVHPADFYRDNAIELVLGTPVTALDVSAKVVSDASGRRYAFRKLLLATGGKPRRLSIPGGDLDGVCYYRTLGDYERIRASTTPGSSVLVIGGGFIGSEIAAALNLNNITVTMVFPSAYVCERVLPESLGRAVQANYVARGVQMLPKDAPVAIERRGASFVTQTRTGKRVESDLLIVGIGIAPSTALATGAGLTVENGIAVNEFLETSHSDVYAAGDNAFFPYAALGTHTRVEHWDNALNQGACAGHNMAGARDAYTYMPYFFSDLFDFGYEAVGEVDARLETIADWKEENKTGVIYYLRDGRVRGVMMCNVWDKVEAARALIREEKHSSPQDLYGAI